MQDDYECFFLLADYQVADYADRLAEIHSAIMDIALDWLAVGLDPSRSHFVVESQVPQHVELAQWLSWYLPLARLQRNPTLKSELADLEQKSVPVAFFTYPVLQAANILLPRAQLVPVGEDQLPHIEMTRELARRLNGLCGPLFPEPDALVGRVARLVGLDGQSKMSKSRANAIYLKDDSATLSKKVMGMFTDPTRCGPPTPDMRKATRSSCTTMPSIPTRPRCRSSRSATSSARWGTSKSSACSSTRSNGSSTQFVTDADSSRACRSWFGRPCRRFRVRARGWRADDGTGARGAAN